MESVDTDRQGKMDGKPRYDSSMSMIGWLVAAFVIWAVAIVYFVVLS